VTAIEAARAGVKPKPAAKSYQKHKQVAQSVTTAGEVPHELYLQFFGTREYGWLKPGRGLHVPISAQLELTMPLSA